MFSVCKVISTLTENGSNINSVGDDSKLIAEISFINEGVVGSVIDKIKAFFRRLKELLLKIYHAVFGGSGSSSRSSSSSGRSSGSGSVSSGFRWTPQNADDIRRKLSNDYFIKNFKWNIHNWDNRYLDSMSDRIRRMDAIRFRMPDGRMINSSASAITREITRCIQDYRSSGREPKSSDMMLSNFKDTIHESIERIYDIPDGESYKTMVPRKICSDNYTVGLLKYTDVEYMIEAVETEEYAISEIENSYKSLMNEINIADREIQCLTIDTTSPELTAIVEALTQALHYKINVITSLEHIHIKAVRDRSAEYCRELLRFINM